MSFWFFYSTSNTNVIYDMFEQTFVIKKTYPIFTFFYSLQWHKPRSNWVCPSWVLLFWSDDYAGIYRDNAISAIVGFMSHQYHSENPQKRKLNGYLFLPCFIKAEQTFAGFVSKFQEIVQLPVTLELPVFGSWDYHQSLQAVLISHTSSFEEDLRPLKKRRSGP